MVTKLEQSILDEQKQLDELTNKAKEKPSEDIVDEVIKASESEEKPEDKKESDKETREETDEEKQKRENDLRAKERISKKESRKKLELENATLKGYVAAKQEAPAFKGETKEAAKDSEPDKDLDPDGHLRWELRQKDKLINSLSGEVQQIKLQNQLKEGKEEIRAFEDAFKMADPDYDSAKEFLVKGTFDQIKVANPTLPDSVIKKEVERLEVLEAAKAVKMGYDPALHFKMMAIKNGYKPVQKDNPKEEVKETKQKIDLKTLEANKKKTSNLMGGSSRGKVGDPAKEDLVEMTIRELAQLEESVWKRI